MKQFSLVPVIILAAVAALAENPPRSIAMPESEVKDVFFGYIVSILLEDAELDIDGNRLLEMFPEFANGEGQVPFHEITRVARIPGRAPEVIIELTNRLDYPVPVDILGYHPGRVFSSRRIVFDERRHVEADPDFGRIRLVWLRSGELGIDFDGWLDVLLGSLVDDVSARVLAVVEYRRTWYLLMGGDTPDGGWITGVYNLQTSRIVVRPPRALTEFGDELSR